MFKRAHTRRAEALDEAARRLYGAVVAQARRPAFYRHLGVPDSLDGRFELIVLHAFLLFHRLKRDHAESEALSQAVFDLLFLDMDQSLREMGVGDLGVGKRIKQMVQAFYGRVAAYDGGLAGGPGELEAALERNLYGTVSPDSAQVGAMAGYLRDQEALLAEQAIADLVAGELSFGEAPESLAVSCPE